MKMFVAILLVMLSSLSFAVDSRDVDSAGFSNLTQEQKLEILSNIEKMKATTPASLVGTVKEITPTPEAVNEWVEVGNNIGLALAGTAKQLGVAATEFIGTPMGKISIVILIGYLFGNPLIHIAAVLTFLLIALPLMNKLMTYWSRTEITYDNEKTDIFGRSIIKRKSWCMDGEQVTGMVFVYIIVFAAFFTTTFSY